MSEQQNMCKSTRSINQTIYETDLSHLRDKSSKWSLMVYCNQYQVVAIFRYRNPVNIEHFKANNRFVNSTIQFSFLFKTLCALLSILRRTLCTILSISVVSKYQFSVSLPRQIAICNVNRPSNALILTG